MVSNINNYYSYKVCTSSTPQAQKIGDKRNKVEYVI